MGLRMWWGLLRIVGIIIGVATMLRLATNEGLVSYDPIFQAWMDRLRDIVELGFLTDIIELGLLSAIDWVRSFGINVPELQDEWRPVFVLAALPFGVLARHATVPTVGWLLIAAVTLAGTLVAGLTGSAGWGLVAAIVTSVVVPSVVARLAGYDNDNSIVAPTGLATLAVGLFGVAPVVAIAGLVALYAVGFLLIGIEASAREKHSAWGDWRFNIGLDILSSMSLALVLAVAFASPPIW